MKHPPPMAGQMQVPAPSIPQVAVKKNSLPGYSPVVPFRFLPCIIQRYAARCLALPGVLVLEEAPLESVTYSLSLTLIMDHKLLRTVSYNEIQVHCTEPKPTDDQTK